MVSDLEVISDQRFPLVCVVPVTGTPGEGLLYPPVAPGQSGLAKRSFAYRLARHGERGDGERAKHRPSGGLAETVMPSTNCEEMFALKIDWLPERDITRNWETLIRRGVGKLLIRDMVR